MSKSLLSPFIIFISILFLFSCSGQYKNPDKVYQYSTIKELIDANLDGSMTYGELKSRGDHGIGTFNGLDGEMIMTGGIPYKAHYDGTLEIVDDRTLTPFAVVDHFNPDIKFNIDRKMPCSQLKDRILQHVEDKEKIYSIKVSGNFEVVNARSVKKPGIQGKGLEYVVKNDNKFDITDVRGDAVGFWFPESFTNSNVPGFHFHFVSEDRKRGGHILDCSLNTGTVYIDENTHIEISLLN